MIALIQFNAPLLIAALLIGFATGGWVARGRKP